MNYNNSLYLYLSEKITIENTIKILVLYFFIIWISLIVWVYKDISLRTENVYFQIFSVSIILLFTPLLWVFIYLIIRPSKTLFESYYEEVETNLENLNNQILERLNDSSKKRKKNKEE